jgi:hypothetical protein
MSYTISIILLAWSASAYGSDQTVDKLVDRLQENADLAKVLDDTVVAKEGKAPSPAPSPSVPSPAPQFFARSPGTAKFTTVPRKIKDGNPKVPVMEYANPDYTSSKKTWWTPPDTANSPAPVFFGRSPGSGGIKTGYSWGAPAPTPNLNPAPGYNKWGVKEEKGPLGGFFDAAFPRKIDDELISGEAGIAGQLKRDKFKKLDEENGNIASIAAGFVLDRLPDLPEGLPNLPETPFSTQKADPGSTRRVSNQRDFGTKKFRDFGTKNIKAKALPEPRRNQFQQNGFTPYMTRPSMPNMPKMPQVRASPVRGPMAE